MLPNKITKNQKPIQSLPHPSGCPNIGVHRPLRCQYRQLRLMGFSVIDKPGFDSHRHI
jgi:hypothetical protein